jgi:23S rRNA (cytosine1962-C5)-methyltransferase
MTMTRVTLKSGKDQSVKRLHPWIFSGAIKKITGPVKEGDLVHVYDNKDNFLAQGHYQDGSIAVRIITFKQEKVDQNFWNRKVDEAYTLRKILGLADNPVTDVYRLFNGEGDGIPGLIIDFYNGLLVTQIHSIGVYQSLSEIRTALEKSLGPRISAIYDKSKSTLPFKADINPEDKYLTGAKEERTVKENDLTFLIDPEGGQKTGFYIDQRENRKLLGSYCEGRTVLNTFGYTGGFSAYALRNNASLVHTVDSSARAIDLAKENIGMNFGVDPRHEAYCEDAFDFLDKSEDQYDLIVLDPPAFAKHQNVLHNALQGYKRLNALAFHKIRSGGILFTFSCSQVVSRENFRKSVFAAAANSGRYVRILHQLSQPPDHPVSIYHPEGEYLKGLVLYVE